MPVITSSLGFPRIGVQRELKRAQEKYWSGRSRREDLLAVGRELRLRHWRLQQTAGIDAIACNDFSLYDHMLDMACLLGCIPARFGTGTGPVDLDTYFAMARGTAATPAMAMTKWFDTNYHYIVPEFEARREYRVASTKVFDEAAEACSAGINPVPVLVGPVTFALLGSAKYPQFSLADTVERLLPVYGDILRRLQSHCATVQLDEPCLVTELDAPAQHCLRQAYTYLAAQAPRIQLRLASYFGALEQHAALAFELPVGAVYVDLVRAPQQLEPCLALAAASGRTLGLGLIDGRNVWRNDLSASLALVERAVERLGADHVELAPSCSLLHVPVDLQAETALDPDIGAVLSFAVQKLDELALLRRGINEGRRAIAAQLAHSDAVQAARRASTRIHDAPVAARTAAVTAAMQRRGSDYPQRRRLQQQVFGLPLFPTTTIGSFPQTAAIRQARADHRAGRSGAPDYEAAMRQEIQHVVRFQERIGLDVLVHGEPERNDMVEYFGEQLQGFAVTRNGWVQSYGSRCVKPPLLYGDVSRPRPMTLQWTRYAQSLTPRVVKGMLTGPVTILQWSFVRDDQPRAVTCRQIALAIRDEVADLECAGIHMIQIDEPAIREGLPLRRTQWPQYLEWAVGAFRLASSGAADATQIHTHMCYSDFNGIIDAVAAMDADVISIETSRSQMKLLDAFAGYAYPNAIGPGVFDIHSPRVPSVEEMAGLLRRARAVLAPEQVWVNPDCGLKTRAWPEVQEALAHMVAAARLMRGEAPAPEETE